MTTGTMNILTARFNTILKEDLKTKWSRLVIFKRDLEQMIENEALDANYYSLMLSRVLEEMGQMVVKGEVA